MCIVNVTLLGLVLFLQACSTPAIEGGGQELAAPGADDQESGVLVSSYTLGAGDEFSISVWRNSDLNRDVRIPPSGKIDLPLVGEVLAAGKSMTELKNELTESFSRYIIDPKVDISITTARNNKIYVMGEVQNPGVLTLDRRIMVWEALLMAGGLSDDANPQKALLLHPMEREPEKRVEIIGIDYKKRFDQEGASLSMFMRNGDILLIPEKRIASVEKFMTRFSNILSPIIDAERMIVLYPQVLDAIHNEDTGSSVIVSP